MKTFSRTGQTAIEYLLLLTLVGVIVIASFSNLLPRVKESASAYFLKATTSIMGRPMDSIPGGWCDWSECHPCNCDPGSVSCAITCAASPTATISTRLCDCPAPIGSGAICAGSSEQTCK